MKEKPSKKEKKTFICSLEGVLPFNSPTTKSSTNENSNRYKKYKRFAENKINKNKPGKQSLQHRVRQSANDAMTRRRHTNLVKHRQTPADGRAKGKVTTGEPGAASVNARGERGHLLGDQTEAVPI